MNVEARRYRTWFGSVEPSLNRCWWVLDDVAERKWGYLAKTAGGPFSSEEDAEAAAEALNRSATKREP